MEKRPSLHSFVVRAVPVSASEEEVQQDLATFLGVDARVRRLHAQTEGVPDPTRPLPVVIVTIPDTSEERLRQWTLFGVLRVNVAAKPKVETGPQQCQRCFSWAHTTGACSKRRRCAGCGDEDHVWAQCDNRPAEHQRWCFVCKGAHSVRYKGCPARKAESERVQEVLQPKAFGRDQAIRTSRPFAEVAAASSPRLENRFQGLEVEERAEQAEPSSRAVLPLPQQRKEKNKDIAIKIAKERRSRDNLAGEVERIEKEVNKQPNPILKARVRTLRAQLRKTTGRIDLLNEERRRLLTEEAAADANVDTRGGSQVPGEEQQVPSEPFQQLLEGLVQLAKPWLEQWGVPPVFVAALQACVSQFARWMRCQ